MANRRGRSFIKRVATNTYELPQVRQLRSKGQAAEYAFGTDVGASNKTLTKFENCYQPTCRISSFWYGTTGHSVRRVRRYIAPVLTTDRERDRNFSDAPREIGLVGWLVGDFVVVSLCCVLVGWVTTNKYYQAF
jgi:hypothetical protein